MSRRQALATIASTTSMSVAAPAIALAAASVPLSDVVAAEHPDAAILKAAARWHELERQITMLRAERDRRRNTITDPWLQKARGFDPRDFAPTAEDRAAWGTEMVALMQAYEPVYRAAGVGDVNDEIERRQAEHDPIAEFLLNDATPTTPAGAVAMAGVALAYLGSDQLNGDPVRDFDNDWDVKYAVAGRDALQLAARLAGVEA